METPESRYTSLVLNVIDSYKREFGEKKYKDILTKVATSDKISGLISTLRYNNLVPSHKEIVYCINEIPFFIFSRNLTQAVGCLLTLQRWHEEVNEHSNQFTYGELRAVAIMLLEECKQFQFVKSEVAYSVGSSKVSLNKNNVDYLVNSGVLDAEKLSEDTLENYNEMLQSTETHETYKQLIREYLLPYKISFYKFIFNKDYFNKPAHLQFGDIRPTIAPSLVLLKEKTNCKAFGYPEFFYMAFPDVVWWATEGKGKPIISKQIGSLPIKEVWGDSKYMSETYLKLIIQLYVQYTNNRLECEIY